MKEIWPVVLFCITPLILVLLLEGLSPFTYSIGVLTMGALFSVYMQARVVSKNRQKNN